MLHRTGMKAIMRRMSGSAAVLGFLIGAAVPASGADTTACEDFSDKAWSSLGRGAVWRVVSPSQVDQLDPDEPWKNNGFFRLLAQEGTVTCSFDVQVAVGKGGAGLFFMGRDAQAMERGDSYLVYYGETVDAKGRHGNIAIGKFLDDKPQSAFAPKFDVPAHPGQWASVGFRFDADKGEFTVWCDGHEVGRARDPQPIRRGNVVSLHSFGTAATFRNLRLACGRAQSHADSGSAGTVGRDQDGTVTVKGQR